MIHTSTSTVLSYVAVFFGLAAGLPTLHVQTALLAARHICPSLTSLPVHWDTKSVPQEVEISLDEALSSARSVACTYTVIGGWNKKPARVKLPMPGLDEPGKDVYDGSLIIANKLGKVLARAELASGVSAIVIDMTPPTGKVFHKTAAWIEYFGQKTRMAPSPESYLECKKFIKKLYEDVSDMMAKYAEETGMIYDLEEVFGFETSVRWSNDMTPLELVNWHPTRTEYRHLPVTISAAMKREWAGDIGAKDLRIEERKYWNMVAHEVVDVRGWCQYFKVDANQNQVFSYGPTDGL